MRFAFATYGIFSIGITAKGVKLLNTTITLMLRKILMDHSYITRHSNNQFSFAWTSILHVLCSGAQLNV